MDLQNYQKSHKLSVKRHTDRIATSKVIDILRHTCRLFTDANDSSIRKGFSLEKVVEFIWTRIFVLNIDILTKCDNHNVIVVQNKLCTVTLKHCRISLYSDLDLYVRTRESEQHFRTRGAVRYFVLVDSYDPSLTRGYVRYLGSFEKYDLRRWGLGRALNSERSPVCS